jgi:hypothetical protein
MKKPMYYFLIIFSLTLWTSCGGGDEPEPEPKPVAVSGVTLNKTALSLEIGASETLTATVAPDNAANKAVVWSSSNGAVAAVDNTGKVTATAAGTTTVTVITADGGKSATCNVTVAARAVSGVSLDKTSLSLVAGDSETLVATVSPADAVNKNVAWSSSNEAVATVDGGGKVTAVQKGTATVTVTTADGGKTATCEVTVEAKEPENYIAFKLDGKDYLIANDENCVFSRRSEEYYTVSGFTESTKTAFTMTVAQNIVEGSSYDIYTSSIYVTSSIRILFTVGDEVAEESFWTDDMSQVGIIGKLTVTELTDERLSGTFNCKMTGGEITNGKFSVKAKEY